MSMNLNMRKNKMMNNDILDYLTNRDEFKKSVATVVGSQSETNDIFKKENLMETKVQYKSENLKESKIFIKNQCQEQKQFIEDKKVQENSLNNLNYSNNTSNQLFNQNEKSKNDLLHLKYEFNSKRRKKRNERKRIAF